MRALGKTSCIFLFWLMTLSPNVQSQTIDSTLFTDTFSYGTGNLTELTVNWVTYAGTTPKVTISSGGLNYQGYEYDNVGSKIVLSSAGEAVYRYHVNDRSTGTIYAAFLLKASSVGNTGHYFFHFGENLQGAVGTPYGTAYVKNDGSGNLQFAVQKKDGALSSYFGSFVQTDTHLVVVGYKFTPSATDNDTVKLWVNPPTQTGTESTPLIKYTDPILSSDAPSLDGVVFWQLGAPDDTRSIHIAGLKVTYSWEEATLPVELIQFFAHVNRLNVDLRWSTATEVNNYGFEVERRLVQGSTFNVQGLPTLNLEPGTWNAVGFVQGSGTSSSPHEYSFLDQNVPPGRYAYRLKQIDLSGAFTYYNSAEVEVGLAPKEFALGQNYPNPFNPSTKIEFSVPENGRAVLKVFNMLGQEVVTLFEGEAEAGRIYQQEFNASSLPTGVYVSRLEFAGQAVMRKMLFVK